MASNSEPHAAGMPPDELQAVDGLTFRELLQSGQPLLVQFGSPQCEPCHAMLPILSEVAARFQHRVRVVRLNVDRYTDIGQFYNIWSLPTLMLFFHGTHCRIRARDLHRLDEVLRGFPAQAPPSVGGVQPAWRSGSDGAASGLLPLSSLHPSLEPYGRDIARVGIAPCLSESGYALDGLICRIGATLAAGVRVGCGQVLTNRHVFEQLAGDRVSTAFTGRRVFLGRSELTGRAAPPPLPGGALVMPWYFGRYGDWAVLDEAQATVCARPNLRSAGTLTLGETLWIVGGSSGERDLVTVGRLMALKGVNGMLHECDVRPGMSGSAVMDTRGRLVGIFSTQFGWPGRRAMFVTIDAIVKDIEMLRIHDQGLPQLHIVAANTSS